ncbi:hypothetical protein [Mycoplasmopsis edwardii]|uniref:Uncharacterized protein n=1 Tax=Mycoplasmopsis edwardii TaxID=53558 RepID=A0ACD4PGL7_9BACT|nr:hypothetical protein [Mycoplasmopsis edwardii]WBP83774.1 hypothetical protein Me_995_000393 [Mycoplasmopsis edwardii]
MLIGNLSTDQQIEKLLFKWNIQGTNDNHNHFKAKNGEGSETLWRHFQSQEWLAETGGNYLRPYYHAKWTRELLGYLYDYADLNLVEASDDKKEKYVTSIKNVDDFYFTNIQGHKYFIQNFNFNPDHMPMTIYKWRKGSDFGKRKAYTGKFYNYDYNGVYAWKTEQLDGQNGYIDSNWQFNFAARNYSVFNERINGFFARPKDVNGLERIRQKIEALEAKKAQLLQLKEQHPEAAGSIDEWIADIESAKTSDNLFAMDTLLDDKTYAESKIRDGSLGAPSLQRFLDRVKRDDLSERDRLATLELFRKLDTELSGIVDAAEHYKSNVKPVVTEATLENDKVNAANATSDKVVDGKYPLALPKDVTIATITDAQVEELKQTLKSTLADLQHNSFDSANDAYKKLVEGIEVPTELKTAFNKAVDNVAFTPETFKDNSVAKNGYEKLKQAEEMKKLYEDINAMEPFNFDKLTEINPELAQKLQEKYNQLSTPLSSLGKNADLADALIAKTNQENGIEDLKAQKEKYDTFMKKLDINAKIAESAVGDPARQKFLDYINAETTTPEDAQKAYEKFALLNAKVSEFKAEVDNYNENVKPHVTQAGLTSENNENVKEANDLLDKIDDKGKFSVDLPEGFNFTSDDNAPIEAINSSIQTEQIDKLKEKEFEILREALKALVSNSDLPNELKNSFNNFADGIDNDSTSKADSEKLKTAFDKLMDKKDEIAKLYNDINTLKDADLSKIKAVNSELASKLEEKQTELSSPLKQLGNDQDLANVLFDQLNSDDGLQDTKDKKAKVDAFNEKIALSDLVVDSSIADPARKKFLDYINDANTSLEDAKKAFENFSKLNAKVDELKGLIDNYKNNVQPLIDDSQLSNEKVEKANQIIGKLDENGKLSIELPDDFNFTATENPALDNIIRKVQEDDVDALKRKTFYNTNDALVELLNKKADILPQPFKDAFANRVEELKANYTPEEYTKSLKDLYDELLDNENKYKKLFNEINGDSYKLDLTKYPKARDEDVAKYKKELENIESWGKDRALAKSILDKWNSNDNKNTAFDEFKQYEDAKKDVQNRTKSAIDKALVITFTVLSVILALASLGIIVAVKKK